MVPEAAFGFAVTQDFGIDQFSFSKIPLPDLELLFGLKVSELSLYHTLEQHVASHIEHGSIVLLETDAFYLPDTAATTYRQAHAKTTIAVDAVDIRLHQCRYFHNAFRGSLSGEDYIGAFQLRLDGRQAKLAPYVEVIGRSRRWQKAKDLRAGAHSLLRQHLARRPEHNPFVAWQEAFGRHIDALMSEPSGFHDYAFHFPRLAGSNFELLSSHLEWLASDEFYDMTAICQRIGQTAKTLQFRLARCVSRRRPDLLEDCFEDLQNDYDILMQGLVGVTGVP